MSLLPKPLSIAVAREAKYFLDQIYATTRNQYGSIDWQKARPKEAEVIKYLTDRGFKVGQNSQGTSIAIGGFRATSTTGLSGALSNWLARAEAVPA